MDAAAFALKCGRASGFGTIAGLYRDKESGEVISVPNEEAIAKLAPQPDARAQASLKLYNTAVAQLAHGKFDHLSDEQLLVLSLVAKVPVKSFPEFLYELESLQQSARAPVQQGPVEAKADSTADPAN